MDWRQQEPRGDRERRVAHDVRPRGPATDSEHSGRCRSDRAVLAEHTSPRRVDKGGNSERTGDGSRRRSWEFQAGTANDGVHKNSRVPREKWPDAEITAGPERRT